VKQKEVGMRMAWVKPL